MVKVNRVDRVMEKETPLKSIYRLISIENVTACKETIRGRMIILYDLFVRVKQSFERYTNTAQTVLDYYLFIFVQQFT